MPSLAEHHPIEKPLEADPFDSLGGEVAGIGRFLNHKLSVGLAISGLALAKIFGPDAQASATNATPNIVPIERPNTLTPIANEQALKRVPDVRGDTITEAKQEVRQAGFKFGGVVQYHRKKDVTYDVLGLRQRIGFKSKVVRKHIERIPVFSPILRPGKSVDNKNPFYAVMTPHKNTQPADPGTPNIPPQTSPAPAPTPETPIKAPEMLSPEQLTQERITFAKRNTVRLPFADNCTGFIVRDADGTPLGVLTVRHCGPGRSTPRLENGQNVIDLNSVDKTANVYGASEGSDIHNQIVGQIDRLLMNPLSNKENDTALYIFKGVDPAKAKAKLDEMTMTSNDLQNHLKIGDTVTSISDPVTQSSNPDGKGPVHAEDFEMQYLGRGGIISALNGGAKPIDTHAFGFKKANPDGSIPSAGASGSTVIVTWQNSDGTITNKRIGVESGWIDTRFAPGVNTISDPQSGNPAIDPTYSPYQSFLYVSNIFPAFTEDYLNSGGAAFYTNGDLNNAVLYRVNIVS